MGNWNQALQTVCNAFEQLDSNVEWIVVGSVGSVLQGCDMEPGDLDLYVKEQGVLNQMAELLSDYALVEKCEIRNSNEWLSSIEEPFFHETFPSGFSWSKVRWKINGFDVEAVHISNSAGIPDSETGSGIWEGGQYIWKYAKQVKFDDYSVPVVPLEIQLESNLRRKREDRVAEILKTLKRDGYNQELLEKALSLEHLAYFNSKKVNS